MAWAPISRQKPVDPIGWMIGNAGDDVGQIGLRIEAIHLRHLNQRVHDCGALAATLGAGNQPRLVAQRNRLVILLISSRM